jgi:hypothetical protein
VASFETGDDPGVGDDDWLMGAEEDSPDLNIAALTHAETRLRYLLFILFIIWIMSIMSIMHTICEWFRFVVSGRSARSQVLRRALIPRQKAKLLILL